NASATDYEALQQMLGPQFEETLRDGDIESHVDTIVRFRNRVNEIANNPVLSDLIERIYERMQVTMRRVALLPGRAEM
ncbi:FCD domain-containing protein, partial [Paenibacillus polymyxa]|nr:FCD domain-containing protein [Paenibacillus polymyxa]